jgi:hypothetical protein
MNEESLGKAKVPYEIDTGRHVSLLSHYPVRLRSLRVLRGVVPPSGRSAHGVEAARNEHVVHFANGDSLSAKSLTLTEGTLSIATPYGTIPVEHGDVEHIVFASDALARPRHRKGDVRITTPTGRLTVRCEKLTRRALFGDSESYGEVRIDRAAIESIEFNIYEKQ